MASSTCNKVFLLSPTLIAQHPCSPFLCTISEPLALPNSLID